MMKTITLNMKLVLITACALCITACGGGGGGSTPETPITQTEVKTAVAELNGLRIDSINTLSNLVPAE